MFLRLNHQKLEIYKASQKLVLQCYRLTKNLPNEEKFNMVQQIRRAALSVHLNIAEGCSRKSLAERKRYFEISRGSIIEIDAALDVAADLDYFMAEDVEELGSCMLECFKMLSAMIQKEALS